MRIKSLSFFKDKKFFTQTIFTLLSNPIITNFSKGKIYTGNFKKICVPGLNCYSCPAAAFSCPIGSFQSVINMKEKNFSFYIIGIMMLYGSLFGRLICGFMCPFGFLQDLINKIPSRKFSTKKLKFLKCIKYFFLIFVVFVACIIFVNDVGMSSPYFCKYICPQGILEGAIPLSIVSEPIRKSLGKLFTFKLMISFAIVILSIFIYRPFCKFICPLGAFYALFNKISIYGYKVDISKCIHCNKCEKVCDMDVNISTSQQDLECIRCGKCIKSCPTNAIYTGILNVNKIDKKREELL